MRKGGGLEDEKKENELYYFVVTGEREGWRKTTGKERERERLKNRECPR